MDKNCFLVVSLNVLFAVNISEICFDSEHNLCMFTGYWHRHPIEVSFAGMMPFLSPRQQRQSIEGLMDWNFYRWQDARLATQPCQYTEGTFTI